MTTRIDFLLLFLVALNGLWYWMKIILKDNGYKVSWFWNHFSDLPNFFKLVQATENKNQKIKYMTILSATIFGIIVFIIYFILRKKMAYNRHILSIKSKEQLYIHK